MGNICGHEIYEVSAKVFSRASPDSFFSFVDPTLEMDPYADKPWALWVSS